MPDHLNPICALNVYNGVTQPFRASMEVATFSLFLLVPLFVVVFILLCPRVNKRCPGTGDQVLAFIRF
jgi:hypothetical protein